MESYEILRAQSEEKLKVATHLIDTTYPLVREPKLLVSVIENIHLAFDLTMSSLLNYEKNLSIIPSYSENFDSKFDVFRRKIATKYSVSKDNLEFILEIKKLLDEHKKSSVEFRRKEKLVMSDKDFNIQTLSIDDVKKKLSKSKKIIEELFKIIKY